MKIVHLSKNDKQGGAARASYRIHRALRRLEVDSKMVVGKKSSGGANVRGVVDSKIKKVLAGLRTAYNSLPLKFYRDRNEGVFSVAKTGMNMAKNEEVAGSDILNLHWINGGYISISGIEKLGKLGKPIVWTLHDQWPFTGGCHYSGGCHRYQESCGACPFLGSNRGYDLTRRIWKRKNRAYEELDLTVVTPSKWLGELARGSSLFENKRVEVIPNPLDTSLFKPADKKLSRDVLNLPRDKSLVLFGALSATEDKRKGFTYLLDGLQELAKREDVDNKDLELVVFGSSHSDLVESLPYRVHFLGHLDDDYSLVLAYSAADVFVIPSVQDNLPNTVLEALSCGTPVVGFKTGGIPDMINHEFNGYLAESSSPESLATGIGWCLEDGNQQDTLEDHARKSVLDRYTFDEVGEKYLNLYSSLLNQAGDVR